MKLNALLNKKTSEPAAKEALLESILDEARSAKTSADLAVAIDKIEVRIGALILERGALERGLQDSLVRGKDQAKAQAAITANENDTGLAQSALAAFSPRRDEMARQEEAQEKLDLIARQKKEVAELEAATKEGMSAITSTRGVWAKIAGHAHLLERTNSQLEAKGERGLTQPSSVIRAVVGEVPNPKGDTEYARRLDLALLEVPQDRPNFQRRAQNLRRGRLGEANAVKDAVGGGMMTGVSA